MCSVWGSILGKSEERRVANVLTIAYTTYVHDGRVKRVKRQAEALTGRGDRVDVICLASDRPGSSNLST
jgi:hypothetical protein